MNVIFATRSFLSKLASSALVAGLALAAAPTAHADPGGIVISEIHYHAASDLDTDDFLELTNTSTAPIDVSGWSFTAGVTSVLPAGTTIDAGARLVLSPNATSFQALYGFAPDAIYTGKLSNSGETVTLVDAALGVVDTVTYSDQAPWSALADGTGPSLELRGLLFDNANPDNWGPSTAVGGTPKAPNSIDGTAPTPKITSFGVAPARPDPGQGVLVSATLPRGSTASLAWRLMFDAEQRVPFLDDASSPGGADDGVYAATLPGQAAGLLVRYRIEADLGGIAFSRPVADDGAHYEGYVVRNPAVTTSLPVVEWFMDDSVYNDLRANHRYDDVAGPAVIAMDGVVHDNARMSIRGQTSRGANKNHWKVEMAPGHLFTFPGVPYGLDEWAIQADYTPAVGIAWETVASTDARDIVEKVMRTQRNGQFWSVGHFMQLADGIWREAEGVKSWAIYSADAGGLRTHSTAAALEASRDLDKKTRESEDFTDVWTLTQRLAGPPSAAQRAWLDENVNLPVLVNYMAVQSIMRNWDSLARNWTVARDTEGTGRWEMWHWDLNNSFQPMPYGYSMQLLTPDGQNQFTTALLNYPDIRQMYYRRLRTLIDTWVTPPAYEERWDTIAAPYATTDWPLDTAKWGSSSAGTSRARFAQMLTERRALYAANTGLDKPIPAAQSASPTVAISEIMYQPGGDGRSEFVELTNPGAESVDLSGWIVEGLGNGYTMQPGTVLLPGGRLVLVRDDVAFRAAHPGTSGVAGSYSGSLGDSGGTLTLKQGARIVDTVTYAAAEPWPAAAAGAGSSLELLDPGLDNALPASWAASIPGGTPAAANSAPAPADAEAPSAVPSLTATATGAGVALSWAEASDNLGVTGYTVLRDGVPVATLGPSTAWIDEAVAPSTPYTYSITASDRAGNTGAAAATTVTTGNPLQKFASTFTGANATAWGSPWTPRLAPGFATMWLADNAGQLAVTDSPTASAAAMLEIPRSADAEVLMSLRWNNTGPNVRLNLYLRSSAQWHSSIRPMNGYGLEAFPTSSTVTLKRQANGSNTTLASVNGAQTVGTAKQWVRLRVVGTTMQFKMWLDGTPEPSTWRATVTDAAVEQPGQLYISIARIAAGTGTRTLAIDDLVLTTGKTLPAPVVDTTPPIVPAALAGTPQTDRVDLSWAPATDNVAVTGYEVFRDGTSIGTPTATTLTDTGLAADHSYSYTVRARDAAGNWSAQSTPVTVRTLLPPDTTAPTAPTGLTATATTSTGTTLAWAAATDDRGVAAYRVLRNGTQVAQVPGLGFTDAGLTAATTYTYTVLAVDAAGNVSPTSAPLQVTTLAQTATTLFSDTFTGADGAAWGSAWTTSVRSGSGVIAQNTGQLATTSASVTYARTYLTGIATQVDSELLVSYAGSPSSTHVRSFYLRGSGGWSDALRPYNGYGIELTNSTTVSLVKIVKGVRTVTSVPNGQAVTDAKQWLRLRVVGSSISFRIWADGSPEPTTWTRAITDTSVTAAGRVFIGLARPSTTSTTTSTVRLDDLRLTDGR